MADEYAWDGIVFYSEGASYSPYLRPIIDALVDYYDNPVYYLTSDYFDPLLVSPPAHVKSYYVGSQSMRTYVMNGLRAKVFAMTMPDLNTFHIKRSKKVKHYTYFHHSLVSTHMVYREGAFDNFDSIMCIGSFQEEEIRQWERARELVPKKLFAHGSPPLDALITAAVSNKISAEGSSGSLRILLAPSWGKEGVIETRAVEIVAILLSAGHIVTIRPHPRTRQLAAAVLSDLNNKYGSHPNFKMNEDISVHDDLINSHVMISDWSGVAMEFAFGLEKPVIFVDVPKKVNNPNYRDIKAIPLEVWYRKEVGHVIQPNKLKDLPLILSKLQKNADAQRTKILALREKLFYNLGSSARRGAELLVEIADGIDNTKA